MNVLITGTGSGFGFGLAKNYLEKGHTVYGISRKKNEELSLFPNFHFLVQDISRFREMQTNLVSFLKDVKTLDLVILNAGMLNEIKDLKDTSLDEIEKVMQVNVWANKVLIENLFQEIPEIKQVVAVSSGAAVSGARGWNAYSLSKATLNMLISLYAKEFVGAHFSALAPGLVDTGMQEYISSLGNEEKFPVVQRLKRAKGTSEMPSPKDAAEIFATAIEKVRTVESGSFQDVRKMHL
ncbi:NAD(P)-dependent dehydrogenase, short-chain alcohol dehydrogenase family [Mariniphaga anaerophila]|uniref:NAD(P)-dependent dehydrogenase, short-chain alcohol dehydrogenase family n=1 Tax=Mariniphaga anaerophila TaxID=1484053 RepID=A0A1M4WGX5_9BACT|nr:SDR family NAD(P)-dependent oxidoreductase [Mariniphaga anaerophila]SHE80486.1 NAD(P)-dependent dehydrogenase, short-chain alcohol dehydrogenase family [Mariniphaga anaerophila]